MTDCDIDCDGYDFKWLWFCLCWWDLAVCEWTLIVLWAPHSLSTTRHVTSPTAVTFAVRTSSLERKVKKVILKSYPQRLEWNEISSLTLWEPALQTNPLETVWRGILAPHWLISAGWPSPVGQNRHKIHNKWLLFHNSAENLQKALFSPDPHWWWRTCLQWRPDEWCSHHHCSESKE